MKPLIDSEVEEEVESLFYTRTPARCRPLFSNLFCLSRPACRSPRSLLLAFGGWSKTGSGDTAVTGPSPDILIFNPASRFEAGHIHCIFNTATGPGRGWSRACLSLWPTLLLQVSTIRLLPFLNFHPVVDGQVFLCGGAREGEQCSRHLWLFQPPHLQVSLLTGLK